MKPIKIFTKQQNEISRLLPGDGTIDIRGLFAALPADLPVSVEVVNFEREKTADPAQWAGICLAASRPFTG